MEYSIKRTVSANNHQYNLRMKGLRCSSGKLIRGCVKDTFSKLSIGSIPSTYQTVITTQNNNKAFGSSQIRFNYPSQSIDLFQEVSSYDNHNQNKINHTSYSTKGYGPFLSKGQRITKIKCSVPGPGEYNIEKKFNQGINKLRKKKIQAKPISQQFKQLQRKLKKQEQQSPGPGFYPQQQVLKSKKGWKSSFETKSKRDTYICKKQTPGPGQYDYHINKLKQNQQKNQQKSEDKQDKIVQVLNNIRCIKIDSKKQVPGPGTYNINVPQLKPLYQRLKHSNNFIEGQINRFGQFQKDNKNQIDVSPGQYQIGSTFDKAIKKKLIQGSGFMSQSKRQLFTNNNKLLSPTIGYNSYQEKDKKSFYFNIYKNWH